MNFIFNCEGEVFIKKQITQAHTKKVVTQKWDVYIPMNIDKLNPNFISEFVCPYNLDSKNNNIWDISINYTIELLPSLRHIKRCDIH